MIVLDTNVLSEPVAADTFGEVLDWMGSQPRSRAAELATRNVADFAGCQLEVINPWL